MYSKIDTLETTDLNKSQENPYKDSKRSNVPHTMVYMIIIFFLISIIAITVYFIDCNYIINNLIISFMIGLLTYVILK